MALVLLMIHGMPTAAAACLLVGLFTDRLDGWVAREFGAESDFGADVLEPICDFTLSIAAVTMLIVVGAWSIWVGVGLLVVAALLQLIHQFRDVEWVKPLKRHQNYIHPLYAVFVMVITAIFYTINYLPGVWLTMLAIFLSINILPGYDKIRSLQN